MTAQATQQVKVIVPHGRRLLEVFADGVPCRLMSVETPGGFGYDVQTWEAPIVSPPGRIMAVFGG